MTTRGSIIAFGTSGCTTWCLRFAWTQSGSSVFAGPIAGRRTATQIIKTRDGRIIELPTEEEDREITRQAREDGTLLTDDELAEFKPFEESDLPESFKQAVRRRGRPHKANPKVPVHIRFSPEVVAHFKATGKGWQTRMGEALKEWIGKHSG